MTLSCSPFAYCLAPNVKILVFVNGKPYCAPALLDAACPDRGRNTDKTCMLKQQKLSSGAQILVCASMALQATAEDVMRSI